MLPHHAQRQITFTLDRTAVMEHTNLIGWLTMTLLNNPQATSTAAAVATVAYFLSFGIALFSYTTGRAP